MPILQGLNKRNSMKLNQMISIYLKINLMRNNFQTKSGQKPVQLRALKLLFPNDMRTAPIFSRLANDKAIFGRGLHFNLVLSRQWSLQVEWSATCTLAALLELCFAYVDRIMVVHDHCKVVPSFPVVRVDVDLFDRRLQATGLTSDRFGQGSQLHVREVRLLLLEIVNH